MATDLPVRPSTDGGVWGSYVKYLKDLEVCVDVLMIERDAAVAALDPTVIAAEQAELEGLRAERDQLRGELNEENEQRLTAQVHAEEIGEEIGELKAERDRLREELNGSQAEAARLRSLFEPTDKTSDSWNDLPFVDKLRYRLDRAVADRDQMWQARADAETERDAAQALLVEEQRGHEATRERVEALLPVVAAAFVFVTEDDPTSAQIEALVCAVDVMPWDAYQPAAVNALGAPTPESKTTEG
jgi:predicted nuclease with TOPRIM domain